MFCPECKSIMLPVKRDGKLYYFCKPCGLEMSADKHKLIKETKQEPKDKKDDGVVDGSHNPLAVHQHICPKCGYDKAELIELGVWYTDEDHNVLYKCGRCGHTEKEDAKVK